MPSILVVTGSVRPNSVNQKVVPLVVSELEKQGATIKIADLKEINLPFYDAPYSPTDAKFEPTNDPARAWTQMVTEADGVVFVTPEYNHTMSPIQMNAIDWIGKEWDGKYVALVGYGWDSAARQAHAAAREALGPVLGAIVVSTQANLAFGLDLEPNGDIKNAERVSHRIEATVSDLLTRIKNAQ